MVRLHKTKNASIPVAADVPATSGMLSGVRIELIERIEQSREEANANSLRLNAKIDAVDAKVDAVDAKVDAVNAKIDVVSAELKAQMHGMQGQMARIEVLVEEQNSRNKVVLDGITALLSRQSRVEERLDRLEAR